MSIVPTIDKERSRFRHELVDSGLLQLSSVDGIYHLSGTFESIARGVEQFAHRAGAGTAEPLMYFRPLMSREAFIRTDYLRSFPDLTGSIDTFVGNDLAHLELLRMLEAGEDWTAALTPAEVMLCSASCHPLYEGLSGDLPAGGRIFEVQGFCFRHEPSVDPARMQSFRQHEFVFVGEPEAAIEHRDRWLDRGLEMLSDLGLEVEKVVANDPFFGRAGRMLAANQLETALKFEIVCPITSREEPTAISSANYHLDHFGAPFGIRTASGEVAHSSCIGFGLERITLALLRTHGMTPGEWPAAVRHLMWP